jgi:hypothetical protein
VLLEKEEKKQEDDELAQLRLTGTVLSNTATDGLHFGSTEFFHFGYFHWIDSVVVIFALKIQRRFSVEEVR